MDNSNTKNTTTYSNTKNEFEQIIADKVAPMFAYWDKDLICRFANKSYLQWFGKTPEEMINKIKINDLLGSLFEKNLTYIKGALDGKQQVFEREITTPLDDTRYSLANYYPDIVNGAVIGFFVHVEDISTIKKIEIARDKLLNDLKTSNENFSEKLKMLEVLNNELECSDNKTVKQLSNPLNSIDGFAQALVKDYFDKFEDEGIYNLNLIRNVSKKMDGLLDNMLNLSRLSKANTNKQNINISDIVFKVLGTLKESFPERKVSTVIEEDLICFGDEELITVLLENLIGNAWKFSTTNQNASIEFGSYFNEKQKVFFIKDNGIGFNMKYYDRLFSAFQNLNNTTEFKGSGIGIGLATVERIIKKHGGSVWAESEEGNGSTFYFTLT